MADQTDHPGQNITILWMKPEHYTQRIENINEAVANLVSAARKCYQESYATQEYIECLKETLAHFDNTIRTDLQAFQQHTISATRNPDSISAMRARIDAMIEKEISTTVWMIKTGHLGNAVTRAALATSLDSGRLEHVLRAAARTELYNLTNETLIGMQIKNEIRSALNKEIQNGQDMRIKKGKEKMETDKEKIEKGKDSS